MSKVWWDENDRMKVAAEIIRMESDPLCKGLPRGQMLSRAQLVLNLKRRRPFETYNSAAVEWKKILPFIEKLKSQDDSPPIRPHESTIDLLLTHLLQRNNQENKVSIQMMLDNHLEKVNELLDQREKRLFAAWGMEVPKEDVEVPSLDQPGEQSKARVPKVAVIGPLASQFEELKQRLGKDCQLLFIDKDNMPSASSLPTSVVCCVGMIAKMGGTHHDTALKKVYGDRYIKSPGGLTQLEACIRFNIA